MSDRPSRVTVLGASGFIGSHLCRRLRARGREPITPGRDESLAGRDLGTVYYCIGLTSDYRERPFDTVEAHVIKLHQVLRECDFDSLVYLSSTKVYLGAGSTHEETSMTSRPGNLEEIFAISKLMGESLCLNSGRPNVRVARLSNILGDDYASGNFAVSLIRDALMDGRIALRSDLESAKDYISIQDAVGLLMQIGERGRARVYNVASGVNLTHRRLVDALVAETGASVEVAEGSPVIRFPEIRVDRIAREFGHRPTPALEAIPELVEGCREWLACPENAVMKGRG